MPKYYNENRKKATQKYLAGAFENLHLRVRKGERQKLADLATQAGYSGYSRFIIDAINEKAGYEIVRVSPTKAPGAEAGE